MALIHLSDWFGDARLIIRLNTMLQELYNSFSPRVKNTPIGGLAVKLVNRSGAASIKGHLVDISPSYDESVRLCPVEVPDCIGVFLDSGIPDGEEAWVVISGVAEVYFFASTIRGHFARIGWGSDTGEVAGQAIAEAIPSPPLSTDKHFGEIGHVLTTRTGPGLAKVVLHFN